MVSSLEYNGWNNIIWRYMGKKMIISSGWNIYQDRIRFQNCNISLFVIAKRSFFRINVCYFGMIRDIWFTNKHYIMEYLNDICIEYKDVFSDDLLDGLSPKRRVNHKIDVILGSTLTCKFSYCLYSNKLEECKTQVE